MYESSHDHRNHFLSLHHQTIPPTWEPTGGQLVGAGRLTGRVDIPASLQTYPAFWLFYINVDLQHSPFPIFIDLWIIEQVYQTLHLHLFLFSLAHILPRASQTFIMEEELNNYNSQWVSFHIRDHLKDGEITVQNTVIEGYGSPPPPVSNGGK